MCWLSIYLAASTTLSCADCQYIWQPQQLYHVLTVIISSSLNNFIMCWQSIYLAASTTLSCADSQYIWQPHPPGTLKVCQACTGIALPSVGRDSDLLRTGHFGDRFPVGARYSVPIQTGRTHPATYTMGTQSILQTRQPQQGTDHPPPSSTKVKERVELYLYSPSGPSCLVLGWTLTLPFTQWVMTRTATPHQQRPFPI